MNHPSSFALRLMFQSERRTSVPREHETHRKRRVLWAAISEEHRARHEYAADFPDPDLELLRMKAFDALLRNPEDSYMREVYIQCHSWAVRRAIRRGVIAEQCPEEFGHCGGWRDPRYDRSGEVKDVDSPAVECRGSIGGPHTHSV